MVEHTTDLVTSIGTIDSVYQANTTAGFSIVTYTGTGSKLGYQHGLGARTVGLLTKGQILLMIDWAFIIGLTSAEYYIC